MPVLRKLSVEEVEKIERKNLGQRKMVEREYDAFLEGYSVGDYGEADLEEDEKRITVRNRLKAAASRRGVALEFRRTKGDTLRFRVADLGEEIHDEDEGDSVNGSGNGIVESELEPEVPVASDQTSKRRGGRPKKQAA